MAEQRSQSSRKPTAEVRLRGHVYEVHFADDGEAFTVLTQVGGRNWRRVWQRGWVLDGIAAKVIEALP